ncbi:signal peptidase I [Oceanobacillus sp. CAU 1775]
MKSKSSNSWKEWIRAIVFAVVIAFILHTFVFATSVVEGESMEPTLENGDKLIFNKFIYFIDEPKRGDIVIIEQPTKNYVKRIIGLPGEVIEIKNNSIYIDGVEYKESFLREADLDKTGTHGPFTLDEDSYFVMGDNRAISKDSRNGLGYIDRTEIIGKSEIIIYPFNNWDLTR